jgi:hypothetical protein
MGGEPAWFGGHRGKFLVYRVNRRPLPSGELVERPPIPEDVFAHFVERLVAGDEVKLGRANKRLWRIGGLESDPTRQTLTGRLGSQAIRQGLVSQWLDDRKDWAMETAETAGDVELLPFGFDGESRLLMVLQHGKSATTIATVFQTILRDNELKAPEPTTDWSVEPVLDPNTFLSWLTRAEIVESVTFAAQLPNPEPDAEFDELWKRMHQAGASRHEETLRAPQGGGLRNIDEDRDFKQAMAMGRHGFATLRGEGRHADGSRTVYRQAESVAAEHVEELPPDWDQTRSMIVGFLKGRLRDFLKQVAA